MGICVVNAGRWVSLRVLLLAVALVLFACDQSPTDNGPVAAAPARSGETKTTEPVSAPRHRTADSGYVMLAGSLADPFLTERNQQPLKKELAQLFAEANVKIVRYQSVQTDDPLLRRIAQEAADSGTAMVQSHQALDAMEQDDGFSSFLVGALGLYLGDPTTIISGASSILARGDAKQQERIKWGAAFNRSRAAQLMLPEAAKAYGGPASTVGTLVSIDLDESFAGLVDHDTIALRNASGRALTNCTVLVELRGRDGDVRQNVHFVRAWEVGGKRFARYGIGIESDSGVYGRRTVYGVQEVRVSVWADEASQESILYAYPGPERDKDVRAVLDGSMKVTYRYDKSPLFGNGPRVHLFLEGVSQIPAHTLTLSFRPKGGSTAKPVSLSWDQGDWNRGAERVLDVGNNLKISPETMEIKVTFPGIDYMYSRTVVLPST